MANEQDRNQNPASGSESDISKSQSQQQPTGQGRQDEPGSQEGRFETDQAQPGSSPEEGLQGDTATQQRTDVEGASMGSKERGEAESGFVGSEGQRDTSSELVEDEESDQDDRRSDGE